MATRSKTPTQGAEKAKAPETKPAAVAKKPAAAPEKKAAAPPQQEALKSAGQPQGAGRVSKRQVPAEEIARRAHELWLQRGGGHGSDHDDWLQAERELTAKDS